MTRISMEANLSEMYTNHCVRASAITVMFQAGVDSKQICGITKHKSDSSLAHYISGTTSEQKRHAAQVLSRPFAEQGKYYKVSRY